MQTAAEARQASNDSLSGLTFIDILISGATTQGSRQINVDGNTISPTMKSTLESNGYTIAVQYFFGDEENKNFPRYIISW